MWGLTSRWQMLLDKHQWLVCLTSSCHRRPDLAGKTLELRSQPAAAAGLATSTSATSVIHVTRVSWKFRFAHATGKGLGRHLGVLCDLTRKASETLFLESDSNTKSRTLECVYKLLRFGRRRRRGRRQTKHSLAMNACYNNTFLWSFPTQSPVKVSQQAGIHNRRWRRTQHIHSGFLKRALQFLAAVHCTCLIWHFFVVPQPDKQRVEQKMRK